MISQGQKLRRQQKRIRQQAARRVLLIGLRTAGASCETCKHFEPAPFALGGGGHICSLHSDFEGYVRVQPDGLCVDHPMAKELVKP